MTTAEIPKPPPEPKAPMPPTPPGEVTSTKKPDVVGTHPIVEAKQLTEAEIGKIVDEDWRETLKLVGDAYETEPTLVTTQLQQAGKPTDKSAVEVEIKRRQDILEKEKPKLAKALEIRRKVKATLEAADKAVATARAQAKPGTTIDEAGIRAQYYNEEEGIYYEVDEQGKVIEEGETEPEKARRKKEIRLSQAAKPFVDELGEMAKETQQVAPDKPAEPTERAKLAKKLYEGLQPRLVEFSKGEYYIDPTLHLDYVRRQEILQTDENVVITVARYLQYEFENLQTGDKQPIIEIQNQDGKPVVILHRDRLNKIPPDIRLARLGCLDILLGQYQVAGEAAQNRLVYFMYSTLGSMREEQIRAISNESLQGDIRRFQRGIPNLNSLYKNGISDVLEEGWGVSSGTLLQPENIPQTLFLSHIAEGHLINNDTELPPEINKALEMLRASPAMKIDVLRSAQKKGASSYLSSQLDFNLEELEADDAAGKFAERAATVMVEKLGISKLDEATQTAYKTAYQGVGQHAISASAEKIKNKLKLPGWAGSVGVMALLSFPGMFQAVAGFGLETEEKGRG